MLGGMAGSDYEAEDGACCQSSELKASRQRQMTLQNSAFRCSLDGSFTTICIMYNDFGWGLDGH